MFNKGQPVISKTGMCHFQQTRLVYREMAGSGWVVWTETRTERRLSRLLRQRQRTRTLGDDPVSSIRLLAVRLLCGDEGKWNWLVWEIVSLKLTSQKVRRRAQLCSAQWHHFYFQPCLRGLVQELSLKQLSRRITLLYSVLTQPKWKIQAFGVGCQASLVNKKIFILYLILT